MTTPRTPLYSHRNAKRLRLKNMNPEHVARQVEWREQHIDCYTNEDSRDQLDAVLVDMGRTSIPLTQRGYA